MSNNQSDSVESARTITLTAGIASNEQPDPTSPPTAIIAHDEPRPTLSPTATIANHELRNQIEQIAATAQGRVGIAAMVLETGETVTLNNDQRFPMQSVYKFPIGMAVLAQVDQGALTLDQLIRVETSDFVSDLQHSPIRDDYPQGVELSVAKLLRYAVSESDGTASDVLLRLIGGPEVVTAYLQDLGINDIMVANTEKELGQDHAIQYQNYATPDAAVRLLGALRQGKGLSETSQALLLQLMIETSTGLNRIKGMLPDGTVVAHKTGSSRTVDGVAAATNDIGIVALPNGQHLAIAVFVSDSTADYATREEVIAQIARATWDAWSE
ncbi:MAG: class A beta-lactamase, subclass A2 [Chloroflexota bacterium]